MKAVTVCPLCIWLAAFASPLTHETSAKQCFLRSPWPICSFTLVFFHTSLTCFPSSKCLHFYQNYTQVSPLGNASLTTTYHRNFSSPSTISPIAIYNFIHMESFFYPALMGHLPRGRFWMSFGNTVSSTRLNSIGKEATSLVFDDYTHLATIGHSGYVGHFGVFCE